MDRCKSSTGSYGIRGYRANASRIACERPRFIRGTDERLDEISMTNRAARLALWLIVCRSSHWPVETIGRSLISTDLNSSIDNPGGLSRTKNCGILDHTLGIRFISLQCEILSALGL